MRLCCPVFGQGRISNDMASNKRRRHTPDQIIRKLAEGNKLLGSGQELNEVCRHLEIAESTWHRWLAQYGGMKANEAKRLKELEAENARLKKLVANQAPSTSTCSRRSRRATSDPEPQALRRQGAARPVRGVRTPRLHGGGHPPCHHATEAVADHHRGGRVACL